MAHPPSLAASGLSIDASHELQPASSLCTQTLDSPASPRMHAYPAGHATAELQTCEQRMAPSFAFRQTPSSHSFGSVHGSPSARRGGSGFGVAPAARKASSASALNGERFVYPWTTPSL